MAKIRTLKRKLSIIRRIEVREIKKREQGKKHKNDIEQMKYYSVRLLNLITYRINQNKLKSIINQKTNSYESIIQILQRRIREKEVGGKEINDLFDNKVL